MYHSPLRAKNLKCADTLAKGNFPSGTKEQALQKQILLSKKNSWKKKKGRDNIHNKELELKPKEVRPWLEKNEDDVN